jgi:hypothetical protein
MTAQAKVQTTVPHGLFSVSEEMADKFGMNAATLHAYMWTHGFFHYLRRYQELNAVEPKGSEFDVIREYCG